MIKKSLIILLIACPLTSYGAIERTIQEMRAFAVRRTRAFFLETHQLSSFRLPARKLNTLELKTPILGSSTFSLPSFAIRPLLFPTKMFSAFTRPPLEAQVLALFKEFRITAHIECFPFLRHSFPEWEDLIKRLSAVFHIVDVYSSRQQLHHLKEDWFQQEWKEVEKLWHRESNKVDMSHDTLLRSEKIDRGLTLMKILLERGK